MKSVSEGKQEIKDYVMAMYQLNYNENGNLPESMLEDYRKTVEDWEAKFAEGGPNSKYGYLLATDAELDESIMHVPGMPSSTKDEAMARRAEEEMELFTSELENTIPWYGLTPEEYETYQHIGSESSKADYKNKRIEEHKAKGEVYNIDTRTYDTSKEDEKEKDESLHEQSEDMISEDKEETKEETGSFWNNLKSGVKSFGEWVKGTTVFKYASKGISNIKEFVENKIFNKDKENDTQLAEERGKQADKELNLSDDSSSPEAETEMEA